MARGLSSLALAVAVVVACFAATALAESDCFTCTHNNKYWCKSNSWTTSPTDGTCTYSSSDCSYADRASLTSECPGYNSDSPYQNCVTCASLSNGFWCKWNSWSTSNTDGFCAKSSSYCPNGSVSTKNSCPDANWGGHSSCLSCTPTAYWCKGTANSGDYDGTCVHYSSNCPAARTVTFSSGCNNYSYDSSAGRILGMSIVLFVFVVVILPVAVTICLIVLCIRAARSRTVVVAAAAPAPIAYAKFPEPVGHQPAPFYPPPPAPSQYPPNMQYYPQPHMQGQGYADPNMYHGHQYQGAGPYQPPVNPQYPGAGGK